MDKKEEEEEKKKMKKMVILKSKDGLEFKVDSALVNQSKVLSTVAVEAEEEVDGEKLLRIPCDEVRGEVLELVIKFWKEHHDHNDGLDSAYDKVLLDHWDKEFVENLNKELLFELMMASHYLDAKKLLDLSCRTVAYRIQDMTVEQVREYFDIVGDFTPEEEAKLREENKWAYDP
ncbi:putative S-phase kinase-associated protein [Dioscorea sansibarensis]